MQIHDKNNKKRKNFFAQSSLSRNVWCTDINQHKITKPCNLNLVHLENNIIK